jgi:UDP-glucose 4-epimerase
MKIIVTGGAGFIGSQTVDALITAGHKVAVLDDLSTGHKENLNPKAVFHNADLRNPSILDVFSEEKPDVVYHLAAQVKVVKSISDPIFDLEVNLGGTINLLEACRKNSVKKIIYSSTGGAVYGEPSAEDLPVKESFTPNPLSFYGIHKHTVEHYLFLYNKNYGLNYTILRYPNIYGPRQDPHGEAGVVAIFSMKLLDRKRPTIFGDGSKTRDYLFVEDVVKANLLVLEKGDLGTFNLGWGFGTRDDEVFKTIKEAAGSDLDPIMEPHRTGEVVHICLDSSKIRTEWGWKPLVAFKEGIKRSVEFYRNRPPWIKAF